MKKNYLYIAKMIEMKKKNSCNAVIANYFLSNLKSIKTMTIEQIAENTDTSYATVCRFLKNLGVTGLKEFKEIIKNELDEDERLEARIADNASDFGEEKRYENICSKICDFSSSVVSHCKEVFDKEKMENVINALSKARSICFTGLGTSAVTAQYAYTKMFRLIPLCTFDKDIIISKMKASIMKKGDVLFAISSSGRTKAIIEIAKIAKSNGALVISICDFAHSGLSEVSDIVIYTTVRDSNKYLDADFPLIQGQLTIIDMIYSCFRSKMTEQSSAMFSKTAEAVKKDKTETVV